jgi:hypothetical protein
MIEMLKDIVIPLKEYEKLTPEEKPDYYWRGIMVQREKEDFNTRNSRHYANSAGGKGGDNR